MNKLEAFEIRSIHRSTVHNAEYNPRRISEDAKRKLRKSIRDFGLLSPIVWNERTGNIVGGHQRISAMDTLMRTDDYELTVAVVDLDEAQEVRANIVMNNPSVMGEWDEAALGEIKIAFPDIDFERDLGFDRFDIDVIFAGTDFGGDVLAREQVESEVDRQAEMDKLKQAKKAHRDKTAEENANGTTHMIAKDDYMVTFVFPNNSEKHDFMRHIREKQTERYVRHTKLFAIQDGKLKAYGRLEDES